MEQLFNSVIVQNILHLDTYLFSFVSIYGSWTYLALFIIIFCETGLVILPFLPGDSLLFASGSIAALADIHLNISWLFILLVIASVVGNQLNYFLGRIVGPIIFTSDTSRLINKKYLIQTHQFYVKHGGKAIILARFIPIIRTFAPFVAGIARMQLKTFCVYNIASATLWVGGLLFLGYFVGSFDFIKDNFSLLIFGIIFISLLPPVIGFITKKFQ